MNLMIIFLTIFFTQQLFGAVQYQFVPENGKVEFRTKGWPNLITIKGEAPGVEGTLTEDNRKISGQLSFLLDTLKTGIDLRDDHMKNKYLQVKEHPRAKLELKEVRLPEGLSGDFEFTGDLSLHGETRKITGTAELEKEGEALKMKADLPIKLSDFNIEIPSYKGITVAEKVNILFESAIKKK